MTVRSEDIFNRPLSKRDEAVSKRIAAEQARGDFSNINFEDIPELTEAQLARNRAVDSRTARRLTRPRVAARKVPVNVRLDPSVLAWLKGKGEGHLTRINDILSNVMDLELGR